ncbi:MAG: META and DUF4377 domain-containing protein [Acidovorax sp.]
MQRLTSLLLAMTTAAALTTACASAPAPDAARQLQAYDWDLAAAFNAQGQPAPQWRLPRHAPARLHFQGRQLSVQNLCNAAGAGYALDGAHMRVDRPLSTLRACADQDLMGLEQRVLALLPQAQRYELRPATASTAPVLVLHFAEGTRWELAGTPTPATRYGSAGERVFLEVAPQRVACNHPLMPNAQCLRVREIRYADNGVKQSTGEWRIFQGEIEGYQHEDGIRNVLRLQRYAIANPPADAPRHAYVLDMVVESERAR